MDMARTERLMEDVSARADTRPACGSRGDFSAVKDIICSDRWEQTTENSGFLQAHVQRDFGAKITDVGNLEKSTGKTEFPTKKCE